LCPYPSTIRLKKNTSGNYAKVRIIRSIIKRSLKQRRKYLYLLQREGTFAKSKAQSSCIL